MSRAKRRAWVIIAAVGSALILAAAYATLSWKRSTPICLAFANSLTGPSSSAGTESLIAAQIYIDQVNVTGGLDGRRIELAVFDDASNADVARDTVQPIADSPCLAVLGHYLSTASLAAGTGYKFVGIPALTGTSFVDDLTSANEYYFRAQTTSSVQGRSIAEYLRAVMKAPVVHLVYSRDRFGRSFVRGFAQGYQQQHVDAFAFEVDADTRAASIREMVETLAKEPEPGIIVVGTGADYIAEVVKAVRRRGLMVPIMTAGGAGSEEFLQSFANEPEEKQHPGFFSEKLYASPPLIFDSAGAAAQAFAAAYTKRSGRSPDWIAAGAYDAARVMVEALRRAQVQNRPETKGADRERVRAALAKINSPQTAVTGLTGPLYFDADRDMPNAVRVGFFRSGRFVTAPLQLVPVAHPEAISLAEEEAKSRVVSFGARHYWLQRAVYTGIDINRVNRIDVKQGTFNIDFYLWMRFAGADEAPTRVEFPALLDKGAFDPMRPTQTGQEGGLNYRLYRVSGDFKASFDLHDYPFDIQKLLLHFQNTEQRRELITYVIDRFGLRLTGEEASTVEDHAYSGLHLWRFLQLNYYVNALSSGSTLGKPSLFEARARTEHAGFNAAVVLRRNFGIFILKTLLPLFLLVLVVFATLFFPETLFRERITLPVTAILTSAVLLVSVNSQLGDVGYTVAIESVFYVFFGLCLMTMVAGFAHEQLRQRGQGRLATILDRSAQVAYVVTVIGVVALFVWDYKDLSGFTRL